MHCQKELLWNSETLSRDTTSLNLTLLYTLSQQVGTRSCPEHNQMWLEDFKLVKDAQTGETDYVKWTEGLMKTREGGLVKQNCAPQKLFRSGTERCPVKFLELLMSRRPVPLQSSRPLYLTLLRKPRSNPGHSMQPVGDNRIEPYKYCSHSQEWKMIYKPQSPKDNCVKTAECRHFKWQHCSILLLGTKVFKTMQ